MKRRRSLYSRWHTSHNIEHLRMLLRQYLYFRTSKASKLSTNTAAYAPLSRNHAEIALAVVHHSLYIIHSIYSSVRTHTWCIHMHYIYSSMRTCGGMRTRILDAYVFSICCSMRTQTSEDTHVVVCGHTYSSVQTHIYLVSALVWGHIPRRALWWCGAGSVLLFLIY